MKYFRTLMVGGALLAGIAAGSQAQAQGTPSNPNWSGPYVGFSVEGFSGQSTFSSPGGAFSGPSTPVSSDFSGKLVGGLVGYRWQTGQIVYGIEGEYARGNVHSQVGCAGLGGGNTCGLSLQSRTKVTGQLGYAIGGFLPYAFAGFTQLEGNATSSFNGQPFYQGTGLHNGSVAGVGLDWAITPVTSFGVSYQHAWYRSSTYTLNSTQSPCLLNCAVFSNVAIDPDSLMLNMKFRLNGTNDDNGGN